MHMCTKYEVCVSNSVARDVCTDNYDADTNDDTDANDDGQ